MRGVLALALASGELTITQKFNQFKVDKIVDNRSLDPPNISIYTEPMFFETTGSQYYAIEFQHVSSTEQELLKSACILDRDWHIWMGITDADHTEPTEWWPTVCKRLGPLSPDNPVQSRPPPEGVIFNLPLAMAPKILPQPGIPGKQLLIRSDLQPYEEGHNQVCQAGYHFHTLYYPSEAEGSPPAFDDGVNQRPLAPVPVAPQILNLFTNKLDLCQFITHPCWCERAPPEWNCVACAMTDTFEGRWHCYSSDFPEHQKWCDAVTVEERKDLPNRPIALPEYEELLKAREEGHTDKIPEGIVWLDDE